MPCRGCGRPGTQHCDVCKRKRGTTSERGYGGEHQRARRGWAELIAMGTVRCRRCGELISHRDYWDLGHHEDRSAASEPEHRTCNRATNRRTS
jgi:hypothetical protein